MSDVTLLRKLTRKSILKFGQYNEWDFQKSLDWNLLEFEPHKKMR